MTFRISSRTVFSAVALLSLGASLAVAQDPTRTPQRRIPISKEAPGEVVRVDTVMIYRTDTLTQLRVDTLRKTEYRVDTVTKYPPPMRLRGGLYAGMAGGVSAPSGSIFTPNSAGPSFQAQLGYQGAYQVLGARFDVNYAQPGEDSRFSGFQADPDIWNYNFNLKLQLPWFTHMMGGFGRFAIYGIGGFTITQYKNLPIRIDNPANPDVPLFVAGSGDWHSHGGWNAGGGASLSWKRTELFLESRVIGFTPTNSPMARQIPTMFGINVY